MKNLKELNSKEIGKLVVMCKSDGTPIKMNNGKYIAVAYDSDKSDAENVKACKDFARENKIGEGAISKAKFKKMKETSLTENLELMSNDKGGVKVKRVIDGYKSINESRKRFYTYDREITNQMDSILGIRGISIKPQGTGQGYALYSIKKPNLQVGELSFTPAAYYLAGPREDFYWEGSTLEEFEADVEDMACVVREVVREGEDEEPPFGDPNDPTDYPREGERGEMPEHDMGEMYGVTYGASSEEALKHFESRKNKRRPIKETMDTFDGVCPYCGNWVDPESTECGYCGFDLSDYDECQTSDVDYEGLSGKRFEESEERKLAENPFEDFFKGYEMVMKGMRGLKEGELRTMNRAQALQFARQNRMPGAAFSANTPAEIKKGLQMMKAQLRDMQANRGRYELALQRGFVIAGFGGDLHGIEVPETLMTGELPAGTTPEQAFDQVVDFMRKTIANLTIKLAKAGKDPTALPKQPTKYLESKKLHEKIGVKGHFGIQVRLGCKNNKGDDYLNQILGENGIPAEDAEPFEKATKKEVEASSMYKNAIKKYGKDNVTIIKF